MKSREGGRRLRERETKRWSRPRRKSRTDRRRKLRLRSKTSPNRRLLPSQPSLRISQCLKEKELLVARAKESERYS